MKTAFWLACASFVIALGQAMANPSLILAGFGVAAFAAVEHKPHVLRMLKDGRTIIDNGDGSFTLSAFDGRWWLCRFSPAWTKNYGSTWAYGRGKHTVWFYTPKEATHVDDE